MLIEFCVENHRAIREKQIFSMVPAPADVIDRQEAPDHVVETGHPEIPRLLIDACLFGANGSGKTSLIAAMDFMVKFVHGSADGDPGAKIPVEPFIHSPDCKNRPSGFETTFIFDGTVYQYGFAATQDHIQREWLSVLAENSSEWIELFERERGSKGGDHSLGLGKPLKDANYDWLSRIHPNALLLSTAAKFNAGGDLENAYRWLTGHFDMFSSSDAAASFSYTARRLSEDGWKEKILDFYRDMGISLHGISAEEKHMADVMPPPLPEQLVNLVRQQTPDSKMFIIHFLRDDDNDASAPVRLESESSGIRALFNLAGPVIDTLERGTAIVVDELNLGLHPLAFRSMIAMFCDPETNPKKAQIIFTTHDPTIVQKTFLERDQVWLMDMSDDDWAARLRRLPNFKDRTGLTNFVNDYLQGRYGGVPKTWRQM